MAKLFDILTGKTAAAGHLTEIDAETQRLAQEALEQELARAKASITDSASKNGHFQIEMPDHFNGGTKTWEYSLDNADIKRASTHLQQAASHKGFDFGNGVNGWTNSANGKDYVFLKTPRGAYPTVNLPGYDMKPQADGAMRFTDQQNGSSYTGLKTRDGIFIDASAYQPHEGASYTAAFLDEKSKRYSGRVNVTFDASGEMKAEISGALPKNGFMLKGPDGGIRTLNQKGEFEVCTLSDRELKKQGLSDKDISAHKAYVQNGGRAAMPKPAQAFSHEQQRSPKELDASVTRLVGELSGEISKALHNKGAAEAGNNAVTKPERGSVQR